VRLICPKCKAPIQPGKEMLEQMKAIDFDPMGIELYEGKGCEECRFTGYRGRTGIYEVLLLTEPIRNLILSHASSQQIKQKAISRGMRTLRQDGLRKVLKGITTFSEVMRVTQQEEA
jgi:general secretion pathway protein E